MTHDVSRFRAGVTVRFEQLVGPDGTHAHTQLGLGLEKKVRDSRPCINTPRNPVLLCRVLAGCRIANPQEFGEFSVIGIKNVSRANLEKGIATGDVLVRIVLPLISVLPPALPEPATSAKHQAILGRSALPRCGLVRSKHHNRYARHTASARWLERQGNEAVSVTPKLDDIAKKLKSLERPFELTFRQAMMGIRKPFEYAVIFNHRSLGLQLANVVRCEPEHRTHAWRRCALHAALQPLLFEWLVPRPCDLVDACVGRLLRCPPVRSHFATSCPHIRWAGFCCLDHVLGRECSG